MALKIGDQEFKSKDAAKKHVRSSMNPFDPLNPIWMDLLNRHPNRLEKIGVGIDTFFISQNPVNPQAYQLNIKRIDGSIDHFSWLKCIDGYNKSNEAMLLSAMRLAISPQAQAFKFRAGVQCALCKRRVENRGLRHVDHYPLSFSDISKTFLEGESGRPVKFDECAKSNAAKFQEADKEFEQRWFDYHLVHASFRLLCMSCNVRRPKS